MSNLSEVIITEIATNPGAVESLPTGTRMVIGSFTASGLVHLIRPSVFRDLIPRRLGSRNAWIIGSGIAELVCAVGLATRQRWAPAATAATLVVIWVGNGEMAVKLQRNPNTPRMWRLAAWLRMPMQLPLIYWAWTSPTK